MLLIVLLLFIALFFAFPESKGAYSLAKHEKKILVVNSYHRGLSWTDSLNKGFTESLESSLNDVEFYFENLDAKRQNINFILPEIKSYLAARFALIKPKLIAVTDDDAMRVLEILSKEIPEIGRTPVVFMGVNEIRVVPENFTGIFEVVDIRANFELIKQLMPSTQKVYCVVDNTTTGRVMGKRIDSTMLIYNPPFEVSLLGDCSYKELIDTLSQISNSEAVLFFLFNQDRFGRFFTYEEILDSIYKYSKVPVFGTWSFYLGRGIVGGNIISGYHHGKRAAQLAAMLLQGVSTQNLDPTEGPRKTMLDYKQLKRFKVDRNLITKDVIIVNKPSARLPIHKGAVISALVVFILVIIVAILLFGLSRSRLKNLRLQRYYNQILEQKNAEVEEGLRRAEEANELKSAFLANMSHEIRTPMNSIVGFSKLVRENPDLTPDEISGFLDIISDNSQKLMRLINDIIDISKIDSHQLTIYKRPVQLGSLFSNCFRAAEVELDRVGKNNISMEMSFTPHDAALEVLTDPDRLHQVVMNLLNNAIKFTQSGRIVLGYAMVQDLLRVWVEDTGIGIDQQHHDAVFERFRQVDGSLNREYGGSGLGLSICKGIVEAMGGRIGVSSIPGKGSNFWFEVPVTIAKPGEPVTAQVKPTQSKLKNKVLLIVEDNQHSALLLKEMLKGTGAVLLHASNGMEVSTILNDKVKIDVALVDIYLPDTSGYDVVSKIKKAQPHAKVVAQTANAMDSDRDKSLKAGCDEHIIKPIDRERLLELLNRLLS